MAVLIVQAALAAVRQHLIGLLALLEPRLGRLVAGVAVRVVLHRTAAIGLLQLILGGAATDAEDLVVVTLAHRSGPCRLADQAGVVHMRNGTPQPALHGSRRCRRRLVSPSCRRRP